MPATTSDSDRALRKLVDDIVAGNLTAVSRSLQRSPQLALASFLEGATRQSAEHCFLDSIGRYIYSGDTALHLAAAAYREDAVRKLIAAGANVRARNRHGDEPLHYTAVGSPGASPWNPPAQVATIAALIEAGADPNAANKTGITPLHRAVRTRCAAAVRILLECGADPDRKNKNGSTAKTLALHTTGRGGSGSPEAKSEQAEILQIFGIKASHQ
ncbi:MAG TPA: ankyrin repeat domain-containing protein [Bryobacteraceae bacterium]|nr:ankyrin repeat domain-containing protein [Bryobacteraceae bacterium]